MTDARADIQEHAGLFPDLLIEAASTPGSEHSSAVENARHAAQGL
jgi:hypothetical protein